MYFRRQHPSFSSGLGWFVATKIRSVNVPSGHEELTRRAATGLITDRVDLAALMDGARLPDLADPRDHVKLGEQHRHFLRRLNQTSFGAWIHGTGHIRLLHQNMMAARSRGDEFRFMGEVLHSIQDAFAPAHVERNRRTGDILKLRLYDPTISSGEHVYLTDNRDEVFAKPAGAGLKSEATKAIAPSREYLKLALSHLQQKRLPFLAKPPKQLLFELNSLISRRLWLQQPDLKMGDSGESVAEVQAHLNAWVANVPNVNLPLLNPPYGNFDSATATLLAEFQRHHGHIPDRVVGKSTWEKLLAY